LLRGTGTLDYLDCAADTARLLLCRWCGFAQVPSDRGQVVLLVSVLADGPWFFCAALVGPIANARCGMAIAIAPITTSRSTRRPMMSMT
jgi:hypothetical protein